MFDLFLQLVILVILGVLTRKNKCCQGFTRGSSSIFRSVPEFKKIKKRSRKMSLVRAEPLCVTSQSDQLPGPDPEQRRGHGRLRPGVQQAGDAGDLAGPAAPLHQHVRRHERCNFSTVDRAPLMSDLVMDDGRDLGSRRRQS